MTRLGVARFIRITATRKPPWPELSGWDHQRVADLLNYYIGQLTKRQFKKFQFAKYPNEHIQTWLLFVACDLEML